MHWSTLLDLADSTSVERGQDYAARGLVDVRTSGDDSVEATVRGSSPYAVRLHPTQWWCTCPVGVTGTFCKHLVATALTVDDESDPPAVAPTEPTPSRHDLAGWLASLDTTTLSDLVRQLERQHPEVVEALDRIRAAWAGDVSTYATLVDSLKTRRYLDWREATEHGEHAHGVVDELTDALSPITAPKLLPLLEKAFRHMVRVILHSDDSSGVQGDAVRRLLRLHAATATLARPDPVRLARWMVKAGIDDQDFFEVDVVQYADVLGDKGLAAYGKAIDQRLATDPGHWCANRALQRLAVLNRDPDEIVRLVGKDLAGPVHYLYAVQALREASLDDDALRLALEGLRSPSAGHQTVQLYDEACALLDERGDVDEVRRLRRAQLDLMADTTAYHALRRAAKDAADWPTERLAALDVLLARNPRGWLITLLDEGEADLAWQASREMDVDAALELRLARARGRTHPADVLDGFEAVVHDVLRTADQRSYREAVALLHELRRLCAAAGQPERYDVLVSGLLETHRRRPTLVSMLKRLLP